MHAREIARLESIKKRREYLKKELRTHCHQLVDEVYKKWFDKPTPSKEMVLKWVNEDEIEYSILHAKIIYREDEEPIIKELEEPSHQNKRIIEESIKHLKFYPEIWSLWSHAKEQAEQTLKDVEKLWLDLIKSLTDRFSTYPQLDEWHGYGAKPDDYYNRRITFDWLWYYVQNNGELKEVKITQDDKYFVVNGYAGSLDKTTMEAFIEAFKELATDSAVQKKMKTITAQKKIIEDDIDKFEESLKTIVDDVKRRGRSLKGDCSTCKPWLDELAELEK